jgi:hypothetical protein
VSGKTFLGLHVRLGCGFGGSVLFAKKVFGGVRSIAELFQNLVRLCGAQIALATASCMKRFGISPC